jgi:hypothetical protein
VTTLKLKDVIDTRTDNYHSVVVVKARLARFFVPANPPQE